MPKINEESQRRPMPPTHPEDIAAEADGRAYAEALGNEFFRMHQPQFAELVKTYGDGDAQKLLEALREKFWARIWEPKR